MKTIWDWLEIDYTTDKQTIKKAYAKQAKKYHPEEKPEEFKELRKAYKTAMKYASDAKAWQPSAVINETATEEGEEQDGQEEKQQRAESEKEEAFEYNFKRQKKSESEGEKSSDKDTQQEANKGTEQKTNEETGQKTGKDTEQESETFEHTEQFTYDLKSNTEGEGRRREGEGQDGQEENRQAERSAGQEQPHFIYSHENFDPEMRGRLVVFLRRIDIIYIDNVMCDNIKAWKMLFDYYECKSDFDNHEFVAAVVDTLEQMPKLSKNIRMYIGRQLFSSKNNDVKMRYLKERYYSQQPYKRKPDIRQKQQQKRLMMREIAGRLYGKQSKAYKKYNLINNFVTVVSLCIFGVLMAYAYKITGYDDEKAESNISTKFVTETRGEIVILEQREVYKKRYPKDSPLVSDINEDGYADLVYYDSDTDEFMVEEYNPETSDYMEAENVNDYCKGNVTARVKLFMFLQEDES